MRELLSDPKAPVYLALGAAFLLVAASILILSWRDSVRALGEFLAPLKILLRPRFSLGGLFTLIAAVAVALKIGTSLEWLPEDTWVDKVVLFFVALLGVLVLTFVVQSFRSTFERRPKIGESAEPPSGEGMSHEQANPNARGRRKAGRLRFEQKKRRIFPFRW